MPSVPNYNTNDDKPLTDRIISTLRRRRKESGYIEVSSEEANNLKRYLKAPSISTYETMLRK